MAYRCENGKEVKENAEFGKIQSYDGTNVNIKFGDFSSADANDFLYDLEETEISIPADKVFYLL